MYFITVTVSQANNLSTCNGR